MNVYLLVVQGRPQGKSLSFPRGDYLFGRGSECHVRPNSDWVSRQHCQLRVGTEQIVIRDLGSRNGTLVNGERVIGERALSEGDQVQVGPLVFEIHLNDPALKPDVLPVSPRPKQGDTHSLCVDTKEIVALDPYAMRREESLERESPKAEPVSAEMPVSS